MKRRLFIGIRINPSEKLLNFYSKLRQQLEKGKITWVKPENMHLTLKFLGETDEHLISKINENLKKIADEFKSFPLKIRGLGCFKKKGRTHVIWLGFENTEKLYHLASLVINSMESIGFEAENRPYKAHLTLARVKYLWNEKFLDKLVYDYKEHDFQDFAVSNVCLFDSVILPAGPIYKIINKTSLC